MSGIIGPLTAGRIAFALGTVGVGALIGGAVAEHRDADVGTGALIGGASALAGLALLYGGAAAWKHVSAARTGAAAGASTLGRTLGHGLATPAPTIPTLMPSIATTATHVAPAAANVATHVAPAATAAGTTTAAGWRTWVTSLFQEASSVTTLRPLPVTVPAIARTPVLPVATASSGATFLTTMSRFLPG